jgi:hypothetical protein
MRTIFLVTMCLAAVASAQQGHAPLKPPEDPASYPKVVHKGDKTCVQSLNEAGQVVETCRDAQSEYSPPKGLAAPESTDRPTAAPGATLQLRYYAQPVADLLHTAQTKYGWSLATKITAVPFLLAGALSAIYGILSSVASPSTATGQYLIAGFGGLLVGGICMGAAFGIDSSAGDDIAAAAATR